jgi:hypothetical protein
VADGAAKQAAWALSGGSQPPRWQSGGEAVVQPLNINLDVRNSYLNAISRI